jgi:hypothetical protein
MVLRRRPRHGPRDRKRRQLYKRGFATKRLADQALADALSEINRGQFVRPTRGTLAEYLTHWLETRRADLRPTTVYGYEKVVDKRIIPGIGHVKLSELDASTLEAWYGRLLAGGGVEGKALSAKTVANTAGVLSIALADAVRLNVLKHNPTIEARLPRRERHEMSA